jgi:hypothetical protein
MEPTGAVLPDGGIITDLATKAMHSLLKSEFMGSSRSLGVLEDGNELDDAVISYQKEKIRSRDGQH